MRILIASSLWPHTGHTVRAANIVIYELVRALAKHKDTQVGYLRILRHGNSSQSREDSAASSILRESGVQVLDELSLPSPPPSRSAWMKLINPRRTDFYPESCYSRLVETRISQFRPDVLLVPWSEWITALCADLPVTKFAYYGNPDHKAGLHRSAFDRRYGISKHSALQSALYLNRLEKVHLDVMQCYDLVGDVAENDALYYRKNGHPNAFYVHNIWIDRIGRSWQTIRTQAEQKDPVKIIANVGQLGGTANRYGLELLGREVAPALREALRGVNYELHVLGSGELIPPLAKLLDSREIRLRGFVDDIDQELIESSVFLCLNNGSPFKVGHTRYLHAWSLGCCVVAHLDAAISMPELRHRHNAMLGHSSHEIARLVREVLVCPQLRNQLGLAGYETFRAHFIAEKVASELCERIRAHLNPKPRSELAGEMR